MKCNSYFTDTNERVFAVLKEAVEKVKGSISACCELGGNDGRFFVEIGIPAVCYGTISTHSNIHAPNEFVLKKDLKETKEILKTVLNNF